MSEILAADDRPRAELGLVVNGRAVRARVEPRTHLADLLRDDLGLTGTHLGCEHGVCGACTVLLDGEPARACLSLAAACDGATVTTIEGLDDDEIAAELRAAFTREHALQCGYCTPGMLVTARDLALRLPDADERRVRLGFSGNLCRCTGYVGIVRATMAVIADRRARGIAPRVAERGLGPVGGHAPPDPSHATAPSLPAGEGGPGVSRGRMRGEPQRPGEPLIRHGFAVPPSPARGEGPEAYPADFNPAHSFTQHFTVPFPPERVFALFGEVEAVASCLPGASVTAMPEPDRVEGEMRVGLGPISAAFRGRARIERDPVTLGGRIVGAGQDRGGRSVTQGMVTYRVLPAEGGARVELSVGYTLRGALAQFGRPGIVRDLAARLTAEFARNLEARLAGLAPPPARSLNPLALGLRWMLARLATLWRRRSG